MNDHKSIAEPINLDGSAICPGQKQEGRAWFQDLLDYHAPLTVEELVRWLDYTNRLFDRVPFSAREFSDEEQVDYDGLADKQHRHNEAIIAARRTKATHAGHQLGAREFTLTYSPKMMDDAAARAGMIVAIDKLCRYYSDEIVELRAVGEVGSNGLSHVHCFYKLKGGVKITDKNFKRAWPVWNPKKKLGRGFEGGHHATVKEESDFKGYIDKEVAFAWFEKNVKNET